MMPYPHPHPRPHHLLPLQLPIQTRQRLFLTLTLPQISTSLLVLPLIVQLCGNATTEHRRFARVHLRHRRQLGPRMNTHTLQAPPHLEAISHTVRAAPQPCGQPRLAILCRRSGRNGLARERGGRREQRPRSLGDSTCLEQQR